MPHTLHARRENLHARPRAGCAPVLTVESGDVVTYRDIPDVSWGLEAPTSTTAPRRKVEPRDPERDRGPCLVGPVAVRGAEPGDVIEVRIESLRTGEWGWTYAGRGISTPALNGALGVGDAPLTLLRWSIDHERGRVMSERGESVALRPFLGTIGLAPGEGEADPCPWTPRACGGNMDCRELVAGTSLYLPVMAAGGLLSIGDGHAAQGDGELSGTAVECMMAEARLRLVLHKSMPLATPRARTPEGAWVTLGFGETLDAAAEMAASAMLDVMVEALGMGRAGALALASSRVSLRVTQMVNPRRGVHAVLSPS